MTIIFCAFSLFLGFDIGICFYALCKNELDLERFKHRITMERLIDLQKKIHMSKLTGDGND